nr:peptidoglycan-binding domain-containing protein [uncultured Desulfobacter sp.]
MGFYDTPLVNLYSARDLSFISTPDTSRFNNGDLATVAWSWDGETLYAGGQYDNNGGNPIIAWPHAGKGKPFELQAGKDTLTAVLPLNDGSLCFASTNPTLGRLDSQGRINWRTLPPIVDFRSRQTTFEISATGTRVAAGFDILDDRTQYHYHRVQLNVSGMAMAIDPETGTTLAQAQMALKDAGYDPGTIDGTMGEQTRTAILRFQQDNHLAVDGKPGPGLYTALGVETMSPPRISAPDLAVTQWENSYYPTLNQASIKLKDYEFSRSLAISSDGRRFILGTDWYLRCYDSRGELKWKKPAPSVAWAVNISRDNQTAVALYHDGSLRWHDMETGNEKLAFFLSPDLTDWVLWTPQGFFNFGGSGDRLIGYHINQGTDKEGEFVGADQLRHVFHRADLVSRALTPEGQKQLVAEAERVGDVRKVLSRGLPPQVALVNLPTGPLDSRDFVLEMDITDRGAASAGSCTRSTVDILKTRASPGRPPDGSARPYAENGPLPCPQEK